MILLAVVCLLCAAIPAGIFCVNLRVYLPPPPMDGTIRPRVSVLIPARNEEAGIGTCVRAALASTGVDLDVIVMDDGSTDGTAGVVLEIAAEALGSDSALGLVRSVRLEHAPSLPAGWNGKQHACWALANAAAGELLCFVDADVHLSPEAVGRMAAFLASSGSALVSGFPRQRTVTWLEQLLLPLIHFVLLGYLPLPQMRKTNQAAYAAGCGQFLLVERAAYFASGGHAAIRSTMHDGIKLPRLLRQHGFHTDLADLTSLAECRMYHNAREVWQGLAKNAAEGMGSPGAIVPSTLLLLLGEVVPFALLLAIPNLIVGHGLQYYANPRPVGWTSSIPIHLRIMFICSAVAVLAAWLPRVLAVRRFRQSVWSACLHPVGILALLAVQWYALLRRLLSRPVTWKNRAYIES